MKFSLLIEVFLILASGLAFAANQEINGFRYQSCGPDDAKGVCFEIRAPKAWLTQVPDSKEGGAAAVHAAFSTDGKTEVTILDQSGAVKSHYVGVSATLHPEIKLLTLDSAEGTTTLLSLETGKIETLPGENHSNKKQKSGEKK